MFSYYTIIQDESSELLHSAMNRKVSCSVVLQYQVSPVQMYFITTTPHDNWRYVPYDNVYLVPGTRYRYINT